MKYTIDVSYGEIIDKITILSIKLKKVKNDVQKENILREYNCLQKFLKYEDPKFKSIFEELSRVNNKLWILEDSIRHKSSKKEFDSTYIDCAENIHINNDLRYTLKRRLNELYESEIIEEKLHSKKEISKYNQEMYRRAVYYFENNRYEEADNLFEQLCKTLEHEEPTPLVYEIFFSHEVNATAMGIQNKYGDKLTELVKCMDDYLFDNDRIVHVCKLYAMFLLRQKRYLEVEKYIKQINPVTAYGGVNEIKPETMSYFNDGDKGKTLLIYTSGGLGDKIMFSRFIQRICETQPTNNIIFLVDDCLYWIFTQFNYPNLYVMKYCQRSFIPHYDYHTNIIMLFSNLKLDYGDIYVDYYLSRIVINSNFDISGILKSDMKNIVINWHGNYQNIAEKNNRGINLQALVPLFKMSGINWISVQKEVSNTHQKFLKKNRIIDLSEKIDTGCNSFSDTLKLFKEVDLVISTDTSIVHFAGTANIPCWVMLTKGCEWRWGHCDSYSIWYPNLKLFRQTKQGEWDKVVKNIEIELNRTYFHTVK